jgi:predicted PurR-regulated permease PerM
VPRYSRIPRQSKARRSEQERKRFGWLAYLGMALFFVVCLVWLRGILLPFIIALLIGYILEPLVTRLERFGAARWIGVILVYALLIGMSVLFLRFLVPVINNESGKLFVKLNTALQSAPHFYERLEGGVAGLIDRLGGVEAVEEEPDSGAVTVREDDWGFGPPVHRIPSVTPPSLSTVDSLVFGASDEGLSEAGIPAQPRLSQVRLEGGKAEFLHGKPDASALTIEQVKPGVFGVNLGDATVEIRRLSEGTYSLTSSDRPIEASRFSDLKERVLGSMRKGLQDFSTSLLGGFIAFFQSLISGIMSALVGLVVVFLVGAFFMIDAPRIQQGLRACVPERYRDDYGELLVRLDNGLSGVVRGQLIICLVNGVLSTIGFLIFIPEYAVVLGILAGVLSLVPIFGTFISSVPAVLVALSISFGHALGVLAWIMGIHFVEAYGLNPNIIGRQAHIHPILVVFVLIAGEAMYGMKGILLAVPLTSVVQSLVQFIWSRAKTHVL